MRIRLPAAIFVILMTGCATQTVHSKTSSRPLLQADDHSVPGSAAAQAGRVTLPYTFARHGVEIRVTSIESADSRVLVNVTLQETRGQTFDFVLSTLIQTLTTAGQALPYAGYSLAGKTRADPEIHVDGHDQFSLTLAYASASGAAGASLNSLELRFPTGKYWSSQPAKPLDQ